MRAYFALTLFSLLLFFPGMSNLPVIERDEAHFAQASRQMVQTGEYFKVRFQEKTRFQKPPGINWLQAGFVNLLSTGDASTIWPYRLPSVLGAWLSVMFTYYFSRRLINNRTALLSAGLLASTLLLVLEAHMAVIDAALLLSVVLMQGALWVIFSRGIHYQPVLRKWGWLFWFAMTLGFVLKGVTPLVGFLSMIALTMMTRRTDWLRGLRWQEGFVMFILFTLAWLALVNHAEHSNYLLQMIHRDLLPKLQGGHESHGKPPLFHLAILPLTFWPASLFLWQAGVYAFKNRKEDIVQFLLAWILPTWIFFEIMPTKLPQYVLPTFPAIAILSALALVQNKQPTSTLRWLQVLWWLLSIVLGIAVILLPQAVVGHFTSASAMTGVSIIVMSSLGIYYAWRGVYLRAFFVTMMNAAIAFPLLFACVLPELQPLWLSKSIAKQLNGITLSSARPLYVADFAEPGLVFYLNTQHVVFLNTNVDVVEQCIKAKSYFLMEEENVQKLPKDALNIHIIGGVQGYNYSKGKWKHLILASCF